MLAQGCAARGMAGRGFGAAETGHGHFSGTRGNGGAPGGPPGFTAVAIGERPRLARDLAAVLRLRRLLRDWSPDVVHAHGLRAGAFAALAGYPGALAVTVHNAPPAGGAGRVIHAALERLPAPPADPGAWVRTRPGARMRRGGARGGRPAVG